MKGLIVAALAGNCRRNLGKVGGRLGEPVRSTGAALG